MIERRSRRHTMRTAASEQRARGEVDEDGEGGVGHRCGPHAGR